MASRVGCRIICVGNRYLSSDDIGPRVHDRLVTRELPGDVTVIDGGLMGLDLLGLVETAERVVFVDALQGFAAAGRAVVLRDRTALAGPVGAYGHDGGLAYLLRLLPAVSEGPLPDIAIVGTAPPASDAAIEEVADLCVGLARGGAARSGGEDSALTGARPPAGKDPAPAGAAEPS